MLSCRLLGHRYRFTAKGNAMLWQCQRGCGNGGSKTYESDELARHYAAAFDRDDRDELGRRAPILGLFPLRIWYRLRRRDRPG